MLCMFVCLFCFHNYYNVALLSENCLFFSQIDYYFKFETFFLYFCRTVDIVQICYLSISVVMFNFF